jgi:uncharacterized RDD family membrane protein YckC
MLLLDHQAGPVLTSIVMWLYFAIQESSSRQATLGKGLLNLQVTDLDGYRITFAQASLRAGPKVLFFFLLVPTIGFIMQSATTERVIIGLLLIAAVPIGCLLLSRYLDRKYMVNVSR